MRRSVVVLVVLIAISSLGLASQPGQPLDCSDWVILKPGITCRDYIPYPCHDEAGQIRGGCSGQGGGGTLDVTGSFIRAQVVAMEGLCGSQELARMALVESTDRTDEVVAYVQYRCVDPELSLVDMASFFNLLFDATNGRLRIQVRLSSSPEEHERYPMGNSIVVLEGFPTLFDILETFAPHREQVSFRVPVMPEGFHAADHFDTYWGYVSRPLLSQAAQPLQCNYPDYAPATGEYLTFPDSAPTPAPGNAVYYLTSVTYLGKTRAGRQAIDGSLHGRDAGRLPDCVIQPEATR